MEPLVPAPAEPKAWQGDRKAEWIMMGKQKIPLEAWETIQGSAALDESGLRIQPDPDGFVRLQLKGETARMGGVSWTPEHYLIIDMLADMDAMTTVDIVFFKEHPSEEKEENVLNYHMIPTRRVKMAVQLDELASRRFFLPTLPGMLKGHVKGRPTSVSQMNRVEILIHPGYSRAFDSFRIYEIYLADALPDMTVIGEPMVDELGQWIQKDWNTKTHSVAELTAFLHEEYEKAKAGGNYPKGWSRYGGWLEKSFDATGYFHTHHDGRRWWLVDPDGYAFFSNGMCYGSRMGVHGFVDRMENLFAWLPEKDDPQYRDAWTTADQIAEFVKRNGKEAGRGRYMFNFARANMIRAFGAEGWWDAWVTINAARLKNWGFNTIGVGVNNYFDERVMDYLAKAEIPFVWTLKEFPQTTEKIFRDFPDVYAEEYAENSRIFARNQLAPFVGNPYMIGYFVNNEPEWKFQYINLAERAFAHPVRLASKNALIEWLKKKYTVIDALNAAWNRQYRSFEELYQPEEQLDASSPAAAADFAEMHAVLLQKYAEVPGEALHQVDPDHLNLGMRYGGAGPREMAGCEHYDIFSFNHYAPTVTESLDAGAGFRDMPMIIGEWHIGGGDKGLLSNGLLSAPSQEERGKACEYYMQGAIHHPNCVGIHYFEMNDQPLLGRFDGECMEHGVIDICNRPFEELAAHFRATAEKLYQIADGELEPTGVTGQIWRSR
jgi:hypothetical protein